MINGGFVIILFFPFFVLHFICYLEPGDYIICIMKWLTMIVCWLFFKHIFVCFRFKDGLLEGNAESDTDCEVEEELEEEEDEIPDHHGDIIGTYQFDTDNFKKLSGDEEEEKEEEVKTKDDKKDEMKGCMSDYLHI